MPLRSFTAASRKRNLKAFSLLPTSYDISYIEDNLSTAAAPVRETPTGTINGVNDTFTLSTAPASDDLAIIARNGVVQVRGAAYTISGVTITFQTGYIPKTGDTLEALIWA